MPALIVPDNPRALIAQPDRYEPALGRTAQDFVCHYATAMLPARPRKPQDKAKAEVGVQIVERWILARLRHQRFFSLSELNKAVGTLLEELNQRPLKKLGQTRRAWFERLDCPALRPLPSQRYELAHFQKCQVNIDYHVEVEAITVFSITGYAKRSKHASLDIPSRYCTAANGWRPTHGALAKVPIPLSLNICPPRIALIWSGHTND